MTATKLTFDFNWKLSLCVLFVFPALIRLSFWQVERAEEKKAIQKQWEVKQSAAAEPFTLGRSYADYDRVSLIGRFLPEKYWLKENQIYRGQLGYSVLMPFEMSQGLYIIVDRGWVKGAVNREFIPNIDVPVGQITLTGTLRAPSDSRLIEEPFVEVMQWPHKILEADLGIMGKQSEVEFYNKVLRIDADDPAALVVHWRPINTSSAKHYGYALQWGLMALALIVLYVFASSNLSEWIKTRLK